MTIGIVGLGLMGQALAGRLVCQTQPVLGFDIDAGKTATAASAGIDICTSFSDLLQRARYVVLCVYSGKQALKLLNQCPNTRTLGDQRIFICTATCDPSELIDMQHILEPLGHRLIEMPISGSSKQFAAGQAMGLVACNPDLFDQHKALCESISPTIRHIGHRYGDAAKAKLAINLVLGINRAAMAEGLAFANAIGLDSDMFFSVLHDSAAYSQVMDIKGPIMTQRRFDPPQSRVDQSHKDFGLIIALAERFGMSLPFAQRYRDMLADNIACNQGHLDNAIIIEAIERFGKNGHSTTSPPSKA